MDSKWAWILFIVLAFAGGFLAGKYYAENHSREGFKLEWKFDKNSMELQK